MSKLHSSVNTRSNALRLGRDLFWLILKWELGEILVWHGQTMGDFSHHILFILFKHSEKTKQKHNRGDKIVHDMVHGSC